MTETFEWENVEDYQPLTGVVPIDKALVYGDPIAFLKQHLARRERGEGRDAVVADLAALAHKAEGSPAGDVGAEWRRRYEAGEPIDDL